MAKAVYLVNGARTPIGGFLGSLSAMAAPELGAVAIKAALERTGLNADHVEEVYMGCVVTAGIGQAPARQAMIKAGLPLSAGAMTVGKVCGSGMKAVMLGRSEILADEANLVIAGGMESMSQTPHLLKSLRTGKKMGHQQLMDSMILDGLWDPYADIHMGSCAEQCVQKYQFSREQQDEYALRSYRRSIGSIEQGLFQEEIAPVSCPARKGETLTVSVDEEPSRVDLDRISKLQPAFETTGTITAANASSINDGAAAIVLASGEAVERYGLVPMARILSVATQSQEPAWFSTAPVGAMEQAMRKAGMTLEQIDLFEINEAFAAVVLAAVQELKLDIDKVNVRGGAISLGHPIGASGARILVTLMYALKQMKKRYGMASLCIGGGEATAMVIENLLV